ncbi:MAG: hypothetical protein LBQ69_00740 [Treponema sp.]|nr:hypothetical protein [Treponema sp.]
MEKLGNFAVFEGSGGSGTSTCLPCWGRNSPAAARTCRFFPRFRASGEAIGLFVRMALKNDARPGKVAENVWDSLSKMPIFECIRH